LTHLDEANNEGRHSRGVHFISGGVEDVLQVEHDRVDAGQLLEQHQGQGHHQRLDVDALESRCFR